MTIVQRKVLHLYFWCIGFLSLTVCLHSYVFESYFILWFSSQPPEKCGVLNVTKLTENGKKVR